MPIHVVQVNCVHHPCRLHGRALLADWPTLPRIASAVSGAGARVSVVQASQRQERLHWDGVDYHFVAEAAWGVPNWAGMQPLKIARYVASLGPDVIHVNGLTFPFHIRALCRLGVPVLVQDHFARPRPRLRMLYGYGLAGISGVSFTAAEQAIPFQASGMLSPDIPVYSIVEGSTFFVSGDRDTARRSTGMSGCPALLWVGRLNSNKDPLTVLEAASIASRDIPSLQLWCAFHEAPLLNAVRARIASDPWLRPRVHLLGKQTQAQIEALCRAADLFVLGSAEEGSGYALLEAMACGLPAVVSDIPPFRKITGAGRGALLVERGNAQAFAAAIKSFQERPVFREAVRRHFDENLAFPAIGRQLVSAYQDLISRAT